jgi:sec-independent protein translocase protein TatA
VQTRDTVRNVNLGAGEILLLALLALLLSGPKRLPEVGRQVGRALAEVRRVSREFEREVRDVAEPFEREVRGVTEPFERELRETAEPFEREARELEREARKTYAIDDDYSSFDVDDRRTGETGDAGT